MNKVLSSVKRVDVFNFSNGCVLYTISPKAGFKCGSSGSGKPNNSIPNPTLKYLMTKTPFISQITTLSHLGKRHGRMEIPEAQTSASSPGVPSSPHGGGYVLPPSPFSSEDILFCIDLGPETMVEMKVNGPNGRPYTRLDSIKQAILLFINAKLTINPDHRFAFAALAKSTYWLRKEFSSEADSAIAALRGITVDSSSSHADLTQLFRVATHEAKKSRSQNRIFRVILLYCRSSMPPQFQLPITPKVFTLDVMYLHDKPGPDNCPQRVYDTLVDALERISEYEGYIFESGQGLTRSLFRHMCVLLSHPQQRCLQEDVDIPKPLTKKSPVAEAAPADDNAIVSSQ